MKKFIILCLSLLILAACSNDIADNSNTIKDNQEKVPGEQQDDSEEDTEETSGGSTEDKTRETVEKDESEDLTEEDGNDLASQYEEYDAINDTINLTSNDVSVVEDNQGKRVLLIKDEQGHEKYKSIYIKRDKRLKIIEFDKGQILNKII